MPELPALAIRNLELNDWTLPKETLAELEAHLWRTRPMNIVEFGSGHSTAIFAQYAKVSGATVTSFEHDPRFLRQTSDLLGDLRPYVDLELAPLEGKPPMYQAKMPDLFDFALIDGPPSRTGGRAATFPALMAIDHGPNAEVWLDDGFRTEEFQAMQGWLNAYPGWKRVLHSLPHGLIRLGTKVERPDIDGTGVTITILTGARPELFVDTWVHLPVSLTETADRIVILVNGSDEETMDATHDLVANHENVVRLTTPKILPIGEATALFTPHVESRFWFHLEDDWRYVSTYDGWLDDAKGILNDDPDVAQVRIRHSSEPVLGFNQVTRQPLEWRPHYAGMVSDDAHLTNNPMLVRTDQWKKLWPCTGEKTMQRKGRDAGLRKVVQLHPGAFIHTGDADSLRGKLGR